MTAWPKLKRDLVGRTLRATEEVRTGVALYPAGSTWTVQACSGPVLSLVGPACERCGVRPLVRIRGTLAALSTLGFELLADP